MYLSFPLKIQSSNILIYSSRIRFSHDLKSFFKSNQTTNGDRSAHKRHSEHRHLDARGRITQVRVAALCATAVNGISRRHGHARI